MDTANTSLTRGNTENTGCTKNRKFRDRMFLVVVLLTAVGLVALHRALNPPDDCLGVLNSEKKLESSAAVETSSYYKFGSSIAPLGDFNGDGTIDYVVGAPADGGDGINTGAIFMLLMDKYNNVEVHQKYTASAGFTEFGASVAAGDMDADGIADILVGSNQHNSGALHVLLMNEDRTVKARHVIDHTQLGDMDAQAAFGSSVALLGDVDVNEVPELAVGASGDGQGAVYILFLSTDFTVEKYSKAKAPPVGEEVDVVNPINFGSSVAAIGDFDKDGVEDVVVGASGQGHVYLLTLLDDGSVKATKEISRTQERDFKFGAAVVAMGDLDGDGVEDLAVGVSEASSSGTHENEGTVHVLLLNAGFGVKAWGEISATRGGSFNSLGRGDKFGAALGVGKRLEGGLLELFVGAPGDDDDSDDNGADRGAVYVLEVPVDYACY